MKLQTAPDGSILIDDRLVFLRSGLLLCAALSIGLIPIQLSSAATPSRAALLPLLVGLFCVALAVAVEDSAFRFDAASREVRWTKRRLLGGRAGTIPFDQVTDVALDVQSSPTEYRAIRNAQCQLILVTGEARIPLGMSALRPDQARDVARRLLALVGPGAKTRG